MIKEVVAALIEDGERFLICQRPENKSCGLLWEFPGGKVEAGETKQEAIIRECREELAVTLSVSGELASVVHEYPQMTIHLTLLRTRIASGELTLLEHNDARWITADELDAVDFCPADVELIEILKKENQPE